MTVQSDSDEGDKTSVMLITSNFYIIFFECYNWKNTDVINENNNLSIGSYSSITGIFLYLFNIRGETTYSLCLFFY